MRARYVVALLAALLTVAACQKPDASQSAAGPKSTSGQVGARDFLKWSMDRHKAMATFRATSTWSMKMAGQGADDMGSTRSIVYAKPNKFRLVNNGPTKMVSQSDGKEHIEFSTSGLNQGLKYPAPDSIGSSKSMQMTHPMFNGSLIFAFFEGADGYDDLVDTSGKEPTFGPEAKGPKGEALRTVQFKALGNFGNAEAVIDSKTGWVHELRYDMAPVAEMMKSMGEKAMDLGCVEKFADWSIDAKVEESEFKQKPPDDVKFEDMSALSAPQGEQAAFNTGDPAPDIKFSTLDGKSTKLSNLKGSVVLIDFWATWCGPCVEGLPITNKMHQEFGSKGLKVVAISDEDVPTISNFVKSKGFTFTPYRDTDRSANTAFKVSAIPTMVIVGKDGKIVNYSVGLEPEATLRSRLASAGIK